MRGKGPVYVVDEFEAGGRACFGQAHAVGVVRVVMRRN